MTDFNNRIALITGAAGEIGTATAKVLAGRGATIVAADRAGADWSDFDAAVQTNHKLEGDVREEADWGRMLGECIEKAGTPTLFFNNAGVEGYVKPIHEYELEEFERVQAINVRGVFLGMKHVIPAMLGAGGGSVVNTSSVAGLQGGPGMVAYNTSKHAVVGLTRTAAAEYGPLGVRVNSIHPGPIESRMMSDLEKDMGEGFEREMMTTRIPLGRYGTVEEVAEMAAFLLSDAASFSNGGRYTIDGGMTQI
ncbi:MAG: SDR family oxidoreductase [Pacificimonas sp.]|nr:SDR family oxidoreductase [Pacificimonas sp.]